jgi:hypothetical protein
MVAEKSAATKMGVKEGSRAILVNAPDEVVSSLDLPSLDISSRMTGEFDYIHFFATTQKNLDQQFDKLRKHLSATGMLWVSWPKSNTRDTDLNMKNVIRIGYDHGLVESKAISIDEVWSALKFTHPKKDKLYRNSYGRLKEF